MAGALLGLAALPAIAVLRVLLDTEVVDPPQDIAGVELLPGLEVTPQGPAPHQGTQDLPRDTQGLPQGTQGQGLRAGTQGHQPLGIIDTLVGQGQDPQPRGITGTTVTQGTLGVGLVLIIGTGLGQVPHLVTTVTPEIGVGLLRGTTATGLGLGRPAVTTVTVGPPPEEDP